MEFILYWLKLTTHTKLHGFLVLDNIYRKFINDFSIIARPLTHLNSERFTFT